MRVRSLAFRDGDVIPSRYTHLGEEFSPPLTIDRVSGEARSLALMV